MTTKTLVLPIAGSSSRFEGNLPKWALIEPTTNTLMVAASIRGIAKYFERVILIGLHADRMNIGHEIVNVMNAIQEQGLSVEFIAIDNSNCQPETVMKGIEKLTEPIVGGFLVKDCDTFFHYPDNVFLSSVIMDGNFVTYAELEDYPDVVAANKSYIQTDAINNIINIAEKRVISNKFSVGGYHFQDVKTFMDAYNKVEKPLEGEFHLSHLIYGGIIHLDQKWSGVPCSNFFDWGTQEDWEKYCHQMKGINENE